MGAIHASLFLETSMVLLATKKRRRYSLLEFAYLLRAAIRRSSEP